MTALASQSSVSQFKPFPVKMLGIKQPLTIILHRWYCFALRWVVRNYTRPAFIAGVGIAAVTTYVLYPGRTPHARSTRIDKYTRGLVNTGNDCFANATVQALAALDQVAEYMSKVPTSLLSSMPLHAALAAITHTLREPVQTAECVSVWPFLHVLERVHGTRISRAQQDAHELLQSVLDTLETEYMRAVSVKTATLPEFPFTSVVESRMSCVQCGGTSAPVRRPMMMWEVAVPASNASLEDVLQRSWNEVIEGYACVVCTVKHVLLNKSSVVLDPQEEELLDKLRIALSEGALRINDDVAEESVYKRLLVRNSCVLPVKGVVHRRVSFVNKPTVLMVHLSRSMYAHGQSWRNRKSVGIPETLVFGTTLYVLKSMVRHQGSHSAGHYECYRRKPRWRKKKVVNKPFWRISDTRVSEVKTESVLNDREGAYIVVYEQQ